MMSGEYIAEVRDGNSWRPVVDLDPVPGHGDLATERAVHALRTAVAQLNREAGAYQYRTRYVPES